MTQATCVIQSVIEQHLLEIEHFLGPNYDLTLVCCYMPEDGKDADVILTKRQDGFEKAIATLQKMKDRPDNEVEEGQP